MARLNRTQLRRIEEEEAFLAFHALITAALGVFRLYFFLASTIVEPRPQLAPNPNVYQRQVDRINSLVRGNDLDCHEQLRVNRHTFLRLCCLVRGVGLGDSRNVSLEERVAIFLWILSHHTKQRRTKFEFMRSGETVSRHFNAVLVAVLRLHRMLLVRPDPVPADYHDSRWNWFQAHKNAKGMNGKPFPYYDDWCIFFGKDRATGELAEDPSQMAEASGPIDLEVDNDFMDDVYVPFFGEEHGGGSSHGSTPPSSIPRSSTPPVSSPRSSTPPGSTPRSSSPLVTTPPANAGVVKKGKKRSRFDDSVVESLETFCKSTSEHMGEMVKAMGYSKELSALRKRIPEEVEKLNLNEAEKFKLGAIIAQAEERVDTFFGTADHKKQAWAEAGLHGLVYPLQ